MRDVECVLPGFRYRAVDASGVVENELCPVFVATITADLTPHPAEVAEHRWVTVEQLQTLVATAPWIVSPWLVEQLDELEDLRRHDRSATLC
ncbi:NUDIX domain-containing protein [Nocardioides terrae]|uniref:NUDIX domain-containing protein n=1 Tax=Nocardioides terrae TaxID=574651 RepID=A0A1I1DV48_9ACTN|nr:NUDIX domain-containing protein [Nocardioides terrae]